MANERSYLRHFGLLGLLVLLIGAMPVFDAACAQQTFQRRATQRSNSPQRNDFTAAVQTSPPSALDTTSPLGQALAACDKDVTCKMCLRFPDQKAT